MKISLRKSFFSEKERIIAETGQLKINTFKYDTGVDAVKLENNLGYIIVLPYKGQMIWDAVFNGRSLAMKSTYKEPRNVDYFLDTYGCFFMHCGALRMGCPGEDDHHPLHGELPYADYDDAKIVAGTDEKGDYVGITGTFVYNRGFGDYYEAHPLVKLYADSSLIDIFIRINNLSCYSMELMYMAHVNFRPVDNGRIIQAASWSPHEMKMRKSMPDHYKVSPDFADFLEQLEKNPNITQIINQGHLYYPEVVFYLNSPRTDSQGWTHFMQVHTDGTADYIEYKPKELDHCTRWISRTYNQDGLGLALPGTCGPEGYHAEKKKGNIKEIEPKSTFSASISCGLLNSDETTAMENKINSLLE